jgi:hypothetical protein
VAIVGGETTTNPGMRILISIALLGTVRAENKSCVPAQSRRRDFCDRRTGRFAAGKTSGFRAASGRGALAGGTFSRSRDD